MHPAILDALAVLLPVDCAACGAADRAVCGACLSAIDVPPIESRTPGGLLVRSAMPYQGIPRALILALKEHDRTDVATPLARRLAPLLPSALPLVAVPPSPAAWRRRGYDPVRLLVRRPTLRVLRVARATEVQKSLSVDERAANRAGFLRANRSLAGLRVAILDDVVTTGVTVDAAAHAIQSAGGEVDHAVTLAATPRYFESSR